jgi:ubiquinone/menaquinone biosynthesis C-methylase UbiE
MTTESQSPGTSRDHRFDNAAVRQYAAIYELPRISARRQQTMDLLGLQIGEIVLDIGFGPGYFASELADRVGSTGRVEAVDTSESMLSVASAVCSGKPQVRLQVADAANLPFAEHEFDAALAVQTLAYVPDVAQALLELNRVLKPNGRAVVADIDWGSLIWHARDKANAEKILKVLLSEHFANPYLPRHLTLMLTEAGFKVTRTESLVMYNNTIDPYVFGLTKIAGRFVIGRHGITAENVAAWEADMTQLNAEGGYFFSANQYLFVVERQ